MNDDKYIPKHAKFNDLNTLTLNNSNNRLNQQTEDTKVTPNQSEQDILVNYKKATEISDNNNLNMRQESQNTEIKLNITNEKIDEELPLDKDSSLLSEQNQAKLWETGQFNELKKATAKKPRKLKNKVKLILWFLLLSFFITIFIISFLKIIKWNKDNKETTKIIENIQSVIEVVEVKDDETTELVSSETEEETSDYWYYTKFSLIDVDINTLKEKNKDTVGWINVNNTNVNYPYVQTTDNKFYLDHSYDRSYNDAGWVFMDYRNNSNLDNKNTILYAHSRLDDSMFGSLSDTLKSKWYQNKDNHIIRISTETENSLWQIFSIYKIEEESYYITTDFSDDESYQHFLDTIKGRSVYNFNTTLTTNDKVLTLSTCYSDNIRTVVHAKLIKKSIK